MCVRHPRILPKAAGTMNTDRVRFNSSFFVISVLPAEYDMCHPFLQAMFIVKAIVLE